MKRARKKTSRPTTALSSTESRGAALNCVSAGKPKGGFLRGLFGRRGEPTRTEQKMAAVNPDDHEPEEKEESDEPESTPEAV